MDSFSLFSLVLAAVFAYSGLQVRSGKTELLGGTVKKVKKERIPEFCKAMSYPFFVLAGIELLDTALQIVTPEFAQKGGALMLIGFAFVLCIAWVYALQRKYSK